MSLRTSFINFKTPISYRNELFAGMTVAMTMIPESLSFAILAGLSPLVGLYAAFLMGLITSIFGGRPGMVSGGAGATVVVLMALATSHGVQYLFAAVVMAGVIQFLVGAFKWGKFVRLIPQPVMFGFLNGLAIIIFMSQVVQFKIPGGNGTQWMTGTALWIMMGLTALAVLSVMYIPKLTKKIPSSLLAIVIVFAVVKFFGISTKTVGDIGALSGGFPKFAIPAVPFAWETLEVIFPYAILMASVGLIETLLTLSMVDEITQTKGLPNREAMAQGFGNFVNGFFGGMGGCAMVAQTLVNLEANSRSRLSAFIASLIILLIILFAGPFIEQIPMAALVGVMMIVAIRTFQWITLRVVNKMPRTDIFVGILVTAITVIFNNLAVAVFIGVIISALAFAWESAKRIHIKEKTNAQGWKVYQLFGPLFFGSTHSFENTINPQVEAEVVCLDFKESRIADMSAIHSIEKVIDKLKKENKTIYLKHVSPDCRKKLKKADVRILESVTEDPTYFIPD